MPKPTDAWNRYFRATHVEGEDLYTVSALAGTFVATTPSISKVKKPPDAPVDG